MNLRCSRRSPICPFFGPLAGWLVTKQENIVKTDMPSGRWPALRCVMSTASTRLECWNGGAGRLYVRHDESCRGLASAEIVGGDVHHSRGRWGRFCSSAHNHTWLPSHTRTVTHWESGAAEGSHRARLRSRRRSRPNLSGMAGQNLRTSASPRVRAHRRGG